MAMAWSKKVPSSIMVKRAFCRWKQFVEPLINSHLIQMLIDTCRMPFEQLDKARHSFGTDDDVLLIYWFCIISFVILIMPMKQTLQIISIVNFCIVIVLCFEF